MCTNVVAWRKILNHNSESQFIFGICFFFFFLLLLVLTVHEIKSSNSDNVYFYQGEILTQDRNCGDNVMER